MTRSARLAAVIVLAMAAASGTAATAIGAADLAPAFANTIVSTYHGRKAHLWLNADGSYAAKGRRGKASNGKWRVKGGKLCLSQKKPVPGPFSYCTPLKTGGVGTWWKGKAVTGEPITIQVVAGR